VLVPPPSIPIIIFFNATKVVGDAYDKQIERCKSTEIISLSAEDKV
jgi:hypothetical protein